MEFKDIQIGRCFYFVQHPGLLHEKINETQAKEISSVRHTTAINVVPTAKVKKA